MSGTRTDLDTREGYDRWSEIYDAEENPLILLEEPHLARLCADVRGLRVLDVGCGTGRHAIPLAAAGAAVTAIDFSDGMLARARAKPGAEAVRFVAHDLTAPLPFADGAFDRVLCCLVLDHIDALDPFFAELARVACAGGRVVISVMHPALLLKGVAARFQDPATGHEVRPKSYPNQISDYVLAAARAGLRFHELSEHAVDEALAARTSRAAKYLGWPMLFLMSLAR
jgi:malonyl-CoA O-methyltransferase